MKYDIFLSICQTEVDGFLPNEQQMFDHFFEQVQLADELGFETAWIAETHLSTEVQKENRKPVVPHFIGEIGLNTDIFQMAHKVFSLTENIHVGSAVRNIFCNGGPVALAESVQTFLSLHSYNGKKQREKRKLKLGFASGRFDFSIAPYGFKPRTDMEEVAWPVLKGKLLAQATEIFLRLLNGENIASDDVTPLKLKESDFRTKEDWQRVWQSAGQGQASKDTLAVKPFFEFEKLGVIPKEAQQDCLELVLGSHDENLQALANSYRPVKVFNLSITPPEMIEKTHERMAKVFHSDGGPWQRDYMPRTAMVFMAEDADKAKQQAHAAWENYWRAMHGTIDPGKAEKAVQNSLFGDSKEVARQIREKYHPKDRLMLWFDFNNHDNEGIKNSMCQFMDEVVPLIEK